MLAHIDKLQARPVRQREPRRTLNEGMLVQQRTARIQLFAARSLTYTLERTASCTSVATLPSWKATLSNWMKSGKTSRRHCRLFSNISKESPRTRVNATRPCREGFGVSRDPVRCPGTGEYVSSSRFASDAVAVVKLKARTTDRNLFRLNIAILNPQQRRGLVA